MESQESGTTTGKIRFVAAMSHLLDYEVEKGIYAEHSRPAKVIANYAR